MHPAGLARGTERSSRIWAPGPDGWSGAAKRWTAQQMDGCGGRVPPPEPLPWPLQASPRTVPLPPGNPAPHLCILWSGIKEETAPRLTRGRGGEGHAQS